MAYEPPFTLNNAIVTLVAEIAQKVGHVEVYEQLDRSPKLRKENRIKTIHSSLAIENNSLSIEQVTAVVEGKHVIAPPRDLLEVQNAIATYEALDSFDPTSVDDLLRAHRMLMGGLVREAGCFRSGGVGIFDGDELIHVGTPAAYVPEVVAGLFGWLREGSVHPLVASCVFHYEFEFIHPFQDGNGRMGRLWQTLILSRWNRLFAWLPVESLVKGRQEEYYATLGRADATADCTGFVEFMLGMISAALDDAVSTHRDGGLDGGLGENGGLNGGLDGGLRDETDEGTKGEESGREKSAEFDVREHLLDLVREDPSVTVARMADALGMSKRQVERIVADLKASGRLARKDGRRNGRWETR